MHNHTPPNHQLSQPFLTPNSPPHPQIQTTHCPHCNNAAFQSSNQYLLHLTSCHNAESLPSPTVKIIKEPIDHHINIQEVEQQNPDKDIVEINQNENEPQNSLSERENQISRYLEKNQNSDSNHPLPHYDNLPNDENFNQHFEPICHQKFINSALVLQQQQKQTDFRHVKTYYQHKLSPFYKQFDIQPIKTHHPQYSKYPQSQSLKKLFKQSPIDPEDSFANLRQNAFRDQKKIQIEFDARLQPIENAFIAFIQNYIRQNSGQNSQISPQKSEAIPKLFFQKIHKLQQLVKTVHLKEISQINKPNQQEDFMQNDLFRSINSFIMFLTQKLRFYETWIVQSIVIIIVDTMTEYYSRNQEEMQENLKVSDFPYLYSNILMNTQSKKYDIPFEINCLTMSQFLIYFNQWCSVVQYIKNKKRVDFIEPLKNQIDSINEIYRDNVIKFRKCIKSRKVTYQQRMKKKFIEKKMNQAKKETESGRDLSEAFQNWKINPKIQLRSEGDGWELIPNKMSKVVNTNKYLPFSNYNHKKPYKPIEEPRDFEPYKNFRNNPQEEMNQIDIRYGKTITHEQKNHGIQSINERQKNPSNDYESQQESSREFVPKQSEYVNYFSRQKQDQRKKYEQDWNASLKLLKQIMIDSWKFKPMMKNKVKKQLQEVYSLSTAIKLDSAYHYQLKKQVKAVLMHYPNESAQDFTSNELFAKNIPPQNTQVSPFMKDPFVVIKDFRYRSPCERMQDEKISTPNEQKQKQLLKGDYMQNEPNDGNERPQLAGMSFGDDVDFLEMLP